LWVALSPREPFGLSASGRMRCVYGAEVLLVLVLVHLRLNIPDMLRGTIAGRPVVEYWPLLFMALGFAAVGLAELFQRRGISVLAQPLQRTGLFLPLLPLLAYLIRPVADVRQAEEVVPGLSPFVRFLSTLSGAGEHAFLWFMLGLLYTLVAVLRRSSGWALAAALAANYGLWVIFATQEALAFWLHPQLWLIPLGVILLTAENLNRDRLTPGQSQAVRYAGLLLIYLSSTADLFIHGLGQSVLLPIALALLSVLGVLAGILLRVRAFLFMGLTFLFLVVFSQIWHAAVDRAQTWVWWASGVVLGAAILTLFALFEKRRNDIVKLID